MKKIEPTVKALIAIITLIGIVFSIYFYMEKRYALAEDVQKLEQRLDYKITTDQLKDVQNRMWVLEDRYYKKEMSDSTKEEYRRLLEDKKLLEEKLRTLHSK